MALILLDSSVIFDHLNGRFGRTGFLNQLVEQGHVLACCPVNFTEVYAGLRPGEEEKTAAFLDSLEFLPVTPEIARQAGLLRRDWQKTGQTLSYTDVTIAAVALSGRCRFLPTTGSISPCPSCNSSRCPIAPDSAAGPSQTRSSFTRTATAAKYSE